MAIKELEKKSYFNKLPIRMIVISIVLVGIVTSALIISKPKSNLEEAKNYYESGQKKQTLEDYQGAIADFTKSIQLKPDSGGFYSSRGSAKQELKDYQGAVTDFTEAIRIDPFYAYFYYNRGRAKEEMKDYQGAMYDYTEAIRLDTPDTDSYKLTESLKQNLTSHNRASNEDVLDHISIRAYKRRAEIKLELEDYKGAIADYNEVIRLNPTSPTTHNNRGEAKILSGALQGGLSDLRIAANLYQQIGLRGASLRIQDRIEAYRAYEFILSGDEKKEQKDYKGAIVDYNEAIRRIVDYKGAIRNNPTSLAFFVRADAKKELKDYQGAIADYNEAIRLDPTAAIAHEYRGDTKMLLKDRQGGLTDFQAAANLYQQQGLKNSYLRMQQRIGGK
jgi:tetratricopeptide (TPR) repeat protein